MFLHSRILQEANGIGNAIYMQTCKLKRVTNMFFVISHVRLLLLSLEQDFSVL